MKRQQRLVLHHRQKGFSLVELMISSAIGLLMTAAMLVAFVSSAQAYRVQEAMSQVQETGRFGLDLLTRVIRESGFDITDGSPIVEVFNNSVDGIDKARLGTYILNDDDRYRSEILVLPVVGGSAPAYYLASNAAGDSRQSLYFNKQPLLEDVAGLVFEFGVDSDGDRQIDLYERVATMTDSDWQSLRSVRFYLLVASAEGNVAEQAQQLVYPFADNSIDTSDRRIYRMFVGTAGLRNAAN